MEALFRPFNEVLLIFLPADTRADKLDSQPVERRTGHFC